MRSTLTRLRRLTILAGMGGFEPPRTDPESAVLPLDDIPAGTFFVAVGWAGRIRTPVWRDQNPLPYRLATAQRTLYLSGGEAGIRTLGGLLTHTRLAGVHLQPARSPLRLKFVFTWRRMRDSNPHGHNPAVFKTAALPIRTNPPWRFVLETCRGVFCQALFYASMLFPFPKPVLCLTAY